MKSDKCPQVMSLESASVGSEDYDLLVWSLQTSVAPHLCLRLEAPGYISCCWHNTPKSQTQLTVVELHYG